MSLDHLLLGALRQPASGYDLKAQFDAAFRHFWPAEQSQIYRTLQRLERQGLLASRRQPSDKGPERRVYRTTTKGRAALRKWLIGGPEIGDDRHAFCAQTFFLDELGDLELCLTFLRQLRELFAARLQSLETLEREWREADPRYPDELPLEDLSQQFTLALGLAKYRVIVEWTDACIRRVELRRSRETTSPASA